MRGFTLVESLVALVVISISMMALASLLIVNIKTTAMSEHRINHVMLGQAVMNNVSANIKQTGVGFTQAQAQAVLDDQLQNVEDLYSSTVTIAPTPTVIGTAMVNVHLQWQYQNQIKDLTLSSAVAIE